MDPCKNAYNWACGKFEDEYAEHNLYGMIGGEWNVKANTDYEGT